MAPRHQRDDSALYGKALGYDVVNGHRKILCGQSAADHRGPVDGRQDLARADRHAEEGATGKYSSASSAHGGMIHPRVTCSSSGQGSRRTCALSRAGRREMIDTSPGDTPSRRTRSATARALAAPSFRGAGRDGDKVCTSCRKCRKRSSKLPLQDVESTPGMWSRRRRRRAGDHRKAEPRAFNEAMRNPGGEADNESPSRRSVEQKKKKGGGGNARAGEEGFDDQMAVLGSIIRKFGSPGRNSVWRSRASRSDCIRNVLQPGATATSPGLADRRIGRNKLC